MQDKSLMFYMIRSELEDAVGVENVSTKETCGIFRGLFLAQPEMAGCR